VRSVSRFQQTGTSLPRVIEIIGSVAGARSSPSLAQLGIRRVGYDLLPAGVDRLVLMALDGPLVTV